tara:strand:+ start:319 stop:435 length:117 start_codon:yes stop_codon:yes gene_type:complete
VLGEQGEVFADAATEVDGRRVARLWTELGDRRLHGATH